MDPKEKLKELEARAVAQALIKLEKMVENFESGKKVKLFNQCENAHAAEVIKLCHQVRSLLQ